MTATAAVDSEKAYASAASNSAPSAADPGGSRVPPKISWNCRGATWPHCSPRKRQSFSALKAPLFPAGFSRTVFTKHGDFYGPFFPGLFQRTPPRPSMNSGGRQPPFGEKNAASALFALRSVKRRNRLPALITFRNLRSVVIDTFVLQLGTH